MTPAVIYDFAFQLETSGLAYSTIKSIFRLLNASLPYAQEEGLILKEPLINHRYFITIDKSVRESSLSRAFFRLELRSIPFAMGHMVLSPIFSFGSL